MSALVAVVALLFLTSVNGHGAMTYPPARNTAGYEWNSANKGKGNLFEKTSLPTGSQTGDWTDADTNMCGSPLYITPGT
jgi:hypothetical protein